MQMDRCWKLLLVGTPLMMVVMVGQRAAAQDAASTPAPASQDGVGQVTSPQSVVPHVLTPQDATPQATGAKKADKTKAEEEKKAQEQQAKAAKEAKKAAEQKAKIYTGPNTVIVLPPTPMLDEEGKQRLDPDGNPMSNPSVRQQRDKKGHPLFDAGGKPVFQTASEMGYDEHGKKIHVVKAKVPKMTPMSISRGTYTVDGMIGKAELNYNIADFKYMYLYAPTIGTVVVSKEPFQGGKEEKGAFNGNTLTVTTGDHKLQLASDQRLLDKKPMSAFVMVDRDFHLPSPYPVVGYGTVIKAPYVWPGSRENVALKGAFVQPPPIPVNLKPVLLLSPCPAGEMRKPAPPTLPGQKEVAQPCIPIPKGKATVSGPAAKKPDAAPAATTPATTNPTPQ
jgi:hypothetical protein